MSSWRCRRLAVDASIGTGYLKYFWRCSRYLAVQEASSGQLVSGGAGGSGSRHRIAKIFLVMILSRLFLVPFLVPAFRYPIISMKYEPTLMHQTHSMA